MIKDLCNERDTLPCATYFISVDIDPANNKLVGNVVIEIENQFFVPIETVSIQTNKVQIIDIVPLNSAINIAKNPVTNNKEVIIKLERQLEHKELLKLQIRFEGIIPRSNKVSEDTIRLSNWYPKVNWGCSTLDNYRVTINHPDNYQLVASGIYDEIDNTWIGNDIRDFGIFLGKDYNKIVSHCGNTVITNIFSDDEKECAELLNKTAKDIIHFYKSEFGFYPHPFLSIIPGYDWRAGGFPFATGIVSIHGQNIFDGKTDYWKWITAHEIAHQYFGEYILKDEKSDWLWLALGFYMDREFCRAKEVNKSGSSP